MKTMLVTIPMNEPYRKRLERMATEFKILYCSPKEVTEQLVQESTVILGNVPPRYLKQADKLEWIQLNSAGANDYTEDGILPKGVRLTNATGAYGLAISEHMLGMVLELQKKLHLYYQNQKSHRWQDEGNVTSIYGANTLIVGMGDIGGEFAKRMHALGSTVYGIRRHETLPPDYIEKMYPMEQLDELLPNMDIVALCLPNTKETKGLFNRERLHKMKRGALLINVGRGNVLDQEALCEVLNEEYLGGAGIDVTEPEPLPTDHPLWDAKNIIITPHISGAYHLEETLKRILKICFYNFEAYQYDAPMKNEVDFQTGYRKFVK